MKNVNNTLLLLCKLSEKALKGACYLHVLCMFANDAVWWHHREDMWKGNDHPMKGAECRQRTMSPFQTSSSATSHRCYRGQTSRAHRAYPRRTPLSPSSKCSTSLSLYCEIIAPPSTQFAYDA